MSKKKKGKQVKETKAERKIRVSSGIQFRPSIFQDLRRKLLNRSIQLDNDY